MSPQTSREPGRASGDLSSAWLVLCGLVLVIVAVSACVWIDHNPGAYDWDNAEYINMATHDYYAYQRHGVGGVVRSLLTVDFARPPAYRIVVLPVTLWAGVSVLIVRLISLLLMGVMAIMVYASVRLAAGRAAGILAASLVCSLAVVNQSMRIYRTETALYPCLVAVLFCLIIGLHEARVRWPLWVGLGVALGLGALSKVTFIVVGGSVVLMTLALAWLGALGGWRRWHLLGACVIAGIVAGPLYARNAPAILASAQEATHFVRHSYDSWSWANIKDWLWAVAAWGFGWGATWLVVLLAATSAATAGARLMVGRTLALRSTTAVSIYVCLAAGVPIIVSQVVMTNTWTTRHISPGYIALTMAMCIAAGALGVLRSRLILVAVLALFYVQLSIWTPEAFESRRDVWDWEQFYQVVRGHEPPMYIVHLGNGTSFNPPFIQAPWVRRGEAIRERWLWRYEDGPIDWERIERDLGEAHVVVTAPGYVGDRGDKQDRDNAHNDEFAHRLRGDGRFEELASFDIGGRQDGATILVFVRRVWPRAGES